MRARFTRHRKYNSKKKRLANKSSAFPYLRRDSNPHNRLWSKDFKSFVSTIPPLRQPHLFQKTCKNSFFNSENKRENMNSEWHSHFDAILPVYQKTRQYQEYKKRLMLRLGVFSNSLSTITIWLIRQNAGSNLLVRCLISSITSSIEAIARRSFNASLSG